MSRHVVFHGAALVVWSILVVPTLTVWADSIPWISFMSVYAVVVGHQAALEAALAKRSVERQGGE